MHDFLDTENPYWEKFKTIINNNRLAQSLLFVSPALLKAERLIYALIALSLCSGKTPHPCLHCSDCLMVMQSQHPDILLIAPEKPGSPIKIDQIRLLQTEVYQTPQRGKVRFVIIKPAENMNRAAANALLKILEEPPAHTRFLLMAGNLATLPATILSRCQIWRMNPENRKNHYNLLESDDISIEMYNQCELILKNLVDLFKGEFIPSSLAAHWKNIPLQELLGLLYRIYAQTLMPKGNSDLDSLIKILGESVRPQKIFCQLDKINALQKKLSHNIHVNNMLAIEDLLIDLCQGETYV